MTKWEHRVLKLQGLPDRDEGTLTALGQGGWELVTVTVDPNQASSARFTAYVKRPSPDRPKPEEIW